MKWIWCRCHLYIWFFLKQNEDAVVARETEAGLGGGMETTGTSGTFESDFPLRVTTETYGARILSLEISPQTKRLSRAVASSMFPAPMHLPNRTIPTNLPSATSSSIIFLISSSATALTWNLTSSREELAGYANLDIASANKFSFPGRNSVFKLNRKKISCHLARRPLVHEGVSTCSVTDGQF